MAENSEYILEPLREGPEFALYRGTERGNQMPILALSVASEQPSPQSLRRLEHEYSLAAELDAEWAAQPLALTRHQGRAILILKDPGGEPLDQLLDRVLEQDNGQPIDLARFLRVAIGLAAALSQAHRQGLIHRDVKPANMLVNDAGRAWLTGFGIASKLRHERQGPVPPEIIAGTLAYMSPEQIGRMNRSMDTRSDLYSLGVTLGEITASLAHEIRQPISGAITNANVCLRKLGHENPNLDEVRAAVTRIARDAQRAAEIINRIRAQFEKGSVNQEALGVSEMIQETVALLRDEAVRYKIAVRTELAVDLPQIVGDRVQLQQVAMNLIINSIEAMKDVDGIREMVIKSQRAEDDQILVTVNDTGVGFPPQLAEQLFDPFFTTKPHGTGMGLRISRSIVESHGGRLWAVCSPGSGATFHLNLPAAISGNK